MKLFMDLDENYDIEKCIRHNIDVARRVRKDLKKLDEIDSSSYSGKTIVEDKKEKEETIDEENEEYLYYYENMMDSIKDGMPFEEMKIAIYENLPSIENGNYANIIRRIIADLLLERYNYELVKVGEDEDTIAAFCDEQKRIDDIIKIVRSHSATEIINQKVGIERRKNNIVFLRTSSGSVYLENDFASIPEEYYPLFRSLIETIEDGTFKNVKRFSGADNKVKGISEVKDYKIRIVFSRIDEYTYVVLYAFVKKTDQDAVYKERLANRIDYYRKNAEAIKACLTEEYISENNEIYQNLKQGLSSRKIIKTKGLK